MKQTRRYKLLSFLICTCFIVLISCKSKLSNDLNKNKPIRIDFCSLENHKNDLIITDLIYSGVDEYWSASGYNDCGDEYTNVYLNFEDYYWQKGNKSIVKKLDKIHKKYYLYKAKMTVTGIFQDSPLEEDMIINQDTVKGTLNGFGHLNSYKSRIKIIRVNSIKIFKK